MTEGRDRENDRLTGIPYFWQTPTGVFDDVSHYRDVLIAITSGLANSRSRHPMVSKSYLFDTLQVEFSSSILEEELTIDHLASRLILRAPKGEAETASSLMERRLFYLGLLMRQVEAMRTIGITHIYLTIRSEGRAKMRPKRKRKKGDDEKNPTRRRR